jgi:hypothetical protein
MPSARRGEVGVDHLDADVNVAHERQIRPQDRGYDRNVDLIHATSVSQAWHSRASWSVNDIRGR